MTFEGRNGGSAPPRIRTDTKTLHDVVRFSDRISRRVFVLLNAPHLQLG